MMMKVFYGIMIPFLGTTLGAACVFFMKRSMSETVQKILSGFAAGVMVAASVWSLLIPSIEQSETMGRLSFLPAVIGFWFGILFLLLLDHVIPHLHVGSQESEGPKTKLQRATMMVMAVTLHNIPEGIAVAIPVYHATGKKRYATLYAALSGISEPIGAVIGMILLHFFMPEIMIGGAMAAVAGIMIYISFDTLLPLAREYGNWHLSMIGIMSGMLFIWGSLLLMP